MLARAYLWVLCHVASQPPCLLGPQILNEDIAKRTCEEHQLCVVAVLPHILDTGEARRFPCAVLCSLLCEHLIHDGFHPFLYFYLKIFLSVYIRSRRQKFLFGSSSEVGRQIQKENLGVSYQTVSVSSGGRV